MNVTMVILCLNAGGAERVATQMANHWASRNWNVTILSYVDDTQWPAQYRLDERVRYRPLGIFGSSRSAFSGLRSNLRRVRRLRQAIRESNPDAVVAHMDREIGLTVLATRRLGVPVIGYVHSNPRLKDRSRAWEALKRWTYPRADRMVFHTRGAVDYMSNCMTMRAEYIPNPVAPPPAVDSGRPLLLSRPSLVTVGSLLPVKNHQLLLRAFKEIPASLADWSLYVVGDGPLRRQLEDLRDELGLRDRVHFLGRLQNVYSVLRQADLYAHTSLSEGFGQAICEAMSCGIPVVATDCPMGPREIVRHEVDGLLVPNDDLTALTHALARAMTDPELRKQLGRRAAEVQVRFGFESVMGRWEQLLKTVIAERAGTAAKRELAGESQCA